MTDHPIHTVCMNRILTFCLCSLMWFSYSQTAAASDRARQLIKLSGVTQYTAAMETMLPESLIEFILGADAQNHAQYQALKDSIDQYFSARVFDDAIVRSLQERLSPQELEALIAWYESDLGRHITQLEQASNEETYYNHVNEHLDELLQESDRLDFARRMDSRFQISGYSFQFSAYLSYAMSAGRARFRDPENHIDFDTFFDGMGSLEAALMGDANDYLLASSVHRYRSLSDEELASYESFLNTIAELKYSSAFNTTINDTLRDQAIAWVEQLPEFLGDIDAASEHKTP